MLVILNLFTFNNLIKTTRHSKPAEKCVTRSQSKNPGLNINLISPSKTTKTSNVKITRINFEKTLGINYLESLVCNASELKDVDISKDPLYKSDPKLYASLAKKYGKALDEHVTAALCMK